MKGCTASGCSLSACLLRMQQDQCTASGSAARLPLMLAHDGLHCCNVQARQDAQQLAAAHERLDARVDALHLELGNQQAAVEGAALAAQQRHDGLQSILKALQDDAAVSHQLHLLSSCRPDSCKLAAGGAQYAACFAAHHRMGFAVPVAWHISRRPPAGQLDAGSSVLLVTCCPAETCAEQVASNDLPGAFALLLTPCHLAVQAAQDAPAWQAATADLAQHLQVVTKQQVQGSARFAADVQRLDSSHLEAAAAATSLQTQVKGQAAQLAGLEAALAALQEQVQEHQQQGQRQGQEGDQKEVQNLRAEVQRLASQVGQLQSEVEHPGSPTPGADMPRQLNTLQEQVRTGAARGSACRAQRSLGQTVQHAALFAQADGL